MLEDIAKMLTDEDHKQPYILIGTVLANFHPTKPACVKVSLSGKPVGMGITAWARVAMPSAAGGRGVYSLPDVGDQVVVAFLEGEIDLPIVIGSLFGGTDLPPSECINPLNNVKMVKTKAGHTVELDDLKGITITSAAKQKLQLDDTKLTVSLTDSSSQTGVTLKNGTLQINALSGITIKSGGCEISLDGKKQTISVKAMNINIEAVQGLSLKGMQLNQKGQIVSVAADAQLELKSSGVANVKGTMLKLN